MRESLTEITEQLGLQDRVRFTGFRDDIIDLVNSFDLFVVSSVHEGIPVSVLEAMTLSKAVVSTAVGGMTEIIEHRAGRIVLLQLCICRGREHQPVTEDCSHCHRPHGSVHPRLLKARGPALCQQCHSAAFHPSLPYGGEGMPGGSANAFCVLVRQTSISHVSTSILAPA